MDHINGTRRVNIITIEDPIEFLHRDAMANISQREVGQRHAVVRRGAAARAAPGPGRHPDRRDPRPWRRSTPRSRRRTPATWCFSTLHTTDATQTIHRVLSFYPPHQHNEVRLVLSTALAAVVSLRLVPRADGKGRVPAVRGADQHRGRRRQHPRHPEGAEHPRPDRRGRRGLRDADLRPVADGLVPAWRHHLRECAVLRDQPERVRPARVRACSSAVGPRRSTSRAARRVGR